LTIYGPDLAYDVIFSWVPWFSEAVLLVRIAIVYPRTKLPLLLAFPITIKVARAVVYIIFFVLWGREHSITTYLELPRWLLPTGFFLELFDNASVIDIEVYTELLTNMLAAAIFRSSSYGDWAREVLSESFILPSLGVYP
jgi:hypothetical protein